MKEIERGRTAHKKQTRIKYITHSACPRNKRSQKLSGGNEILKSFLLLGKTFPHILIYIYLQAEVVLLWVCSKFELSLNTFTTIFFRDFLFVVVGLHVNLIWPCTFCHCLFVCAKREREITLYSMAFEIRIQMKLPQSNCHTYTQLPENTNRRQVNLYIWSLYCILITPFKTHSTMSLFFAYLGQRK